jgi:hypothetical protein
LRSLTAHSCAGGWVAGAQMQFNGRTAAERAADVAALKRKHAARPSPAPAAAPDDKEALIDEVLAGIAERQVRDGYPSQGLGSSEPVENIKASPPHRP